MYIYTHLDVLFSVNYNNNDEKNSSPENKEGRKTEKIVM
jgi:hypothetical protein